MFRVEEVIQNRVVVALLAHFTNTFDAFYLLGRVFWCGCEFIAFYHDRIFGILISQKTAFVLTSPRITVS